MNFYFQPEDKLTWTNLKKIRFDSFPTLQPEEAYYGNLMQIPFAFEKARLIDAVEYDYSFVIKENKLCETIKTTIEKIELITPITTSTAKEFLTHIYKEFGIVRTGYFVGESHIEIKNNLFFIQRKLKEAVLYKFKIDTYKYDSKIRAHICLIDVQNDCKYLHSSTIYIDCYLNNSFTVEFPKEIRLDPCIIELQQTALNLFTDTLESCKFEMLIKMQ